MKVGMCTKVARTTETHRSTFSLDQWGVGVRCPEAVHTLRWGQVERGWPRGTLCGPLATRGERGKLLQGKGNRRSGLEMSQTLQG